MTCARIGSAGRLTRPAAGLVDGHRQRRAAMNRPPSATAPPTWRRLFHFVAASATTLLAFAIPETQYMLILGGGALLSLALETGRFRVGWPKPFLFAGIRADSENFRNGGDEPVQPTSSSPRSLHSISSARGWRYRCCSSYLSATRWPRWSGCAHRARGFGVNRQLGRRPSSW